jgi:two-component system, OmpR family, osmolarity sensor histidine kinase EnvZ
VKRPRSLLWQLGGLALAVSFLSLVLHVAVTSMWISPLGDDLINGLAVRIKLSRELLERAPAAERDAVAARLSDSRLSVLRGEPVPPAVPSGAWTILRPPGGFQQTLTERLGPDYQASLAGPLNMSAAQARLQVAFLVDGQRWHVAHLAKPPIEALLTTGLGWFALAAAAVGICVLGGMRFVVGPIRRVAERITTQGAAFELLDMPTGASAEVHALVDSFNHLAERVQSADRTKQQLLAGVSHDLRTPLARLRLRIETQCTPAVAEAAEVDLRAVEHIVAQFLAFVQGDLAAGLGHPESVLAVARLVVAAYAEQGHAITLVTDAPDAQAPDLAVTRLLHNLIDNAVSHGAEPIEVSWREPAAGERELCVWDHGPGLSPAQFTVATQPFVRLNEDTRLGHCGLGLAIVAQIAKQWQATLACRQGPGARFGIVLTWRVVDATADH